MPMITPFCSIRPNKEAAPLVAALPYDVYNRKEACEVVQSERLSFLSIDRAETAFPEDVDIYDDRVYARAKELLEERISDGTFIIEEKPCFYLYELTMSGRSQTGIVAGSAIADYESDRIKKHEKTREDKEIDRFRHVDTTNAHTGPVFLAYRRLAVIDQLVEEIKASAPEYDFESNDHIRHRVWIIAEEETISALKEAFLSVPFTYIADGHHRCASAVKVGMQRRKANKTHTGAEEYNHFLSVLFPDNQLSIMPYNRVAADLNGLDKDSLLEGIKEKGFSVTEMGKIAVKPGAKGTFGMYLKGEWYLLTAGIHMRSDDPVAGLDVSILQDHLLAPLLGINDPRTDQRIGFVGGIRGTEELERRVREDMAVAFSLHATSIQELFDVADAGLLMPPKSTWFEPKLRSGLFIHMLDGNG